MVAREAEALQADGRPVDMPDGPHLPAWMGITLRVVEGPACVGELRARPETLNYRGVFHGGALTTLADVTMALAVLEGGGDRPVTANIGIDFLRPARKSVRAVARPLRVGRGIAVAEAELVDEGYELVAKARGTFRVSDEGLGRLA